MFQLCQECRKAFDLPAAVTLSSVEDAEKSSASPSSRKGDVISSEPAEKLCQLSGETSPCGGVGISPARKKVRIDGGSVEETTGKRDITSVTSPEGKDEAGTAKEEEGDGGGEGEKRGEQEGVEGAEGEGKGEGGEIETEGGEEGRRDVREEKEEEASNGSIDSESDEGSPAAEIEVEDREKHLPPPDQTAEKEDKAEDEESGTPVCSACLGLLDDSFIDSLSVSICEELATAAYEHVKSFALSISTPLSLLIRQSAVLFYLKGNFKITEEPTHAYVKETLRHKLYLKLKPKLNPLKYNVESPFQIVLKFNHSGSLSDCQLAARTWPHAFPQPKRRRGRRWKYKKGKKSSANDESFFNTTKLTTALSGATATDFEKADFISATRPCTYSISFLHTPLFVGGRYCKYSRELPQTPWVVDGVRKAETSVQELICGHIQTLAGASQVKFSSSGREDCDVRMLGDGRPFLVELINPRKTWLDPAEVTELQSKINSGTDLVEVKRLRVMVKADASILKEGEAEKRKEYRALVWAPKEVTQADLDRLAEMGETVLHQKTPIRVLHRRALATRERSVYCMQGELVDAHHFYLELTSQAGTYIKEFVHGDFGRTKPSLRDIMKQDVDILSLDVCNVLLDWPPPES